jgi:cell division protein FtsN
MSKSDEYREMQISSGQLAAVILSLLALCVLIFYLGIRVGTKKATDDAAAAALKTQAPSAVPLNPVSAEEPISQPDLTASNPPAAETETGLKTPPVETTSKPAETKAAPAVTKPKPLETKPAPKVETKPAAAEKKPAAIETKPKTEATKTKTETAPSGTFYIQAGAVDTRPGAESIAQKIESLGFRAIVLNPFTGDKKTVFRVRVGPYETKEAADAARSKLAGALKKKPADFFIVRG